MADCSSSLPFAIQHAINSKVSHPNICLYMGACVTDGKLMLVTDYYETSLAELLFSDKLLSLPLRMRMALDIATGINWCAHDPSPFLRLGG